MNTRLLILVLCIVALALEGQIGCSHAPKVADAPGPEVRINLENPRNLPDDTRVNLGVTGIAWGRYNPDIKLREPLDKTTGVSSGAGASALSTAIAIGSMGQAGIFLLPLIPVAAVVGAAAGGSAGVPAEKVEAARISIETAIRDFKIQELLRNQIIENRREETPYPVVRVEEIGPTSRVEKVSYHSLAVAKTDTVLEVAVTGCNLEGLGYTPGSGLKYINSSLWLSIDTRVRLIRAAENKEFFDRSFTTICYGQRLKMLEWGADDPALLKQEIAKCLPSVGDRIVKDFLAPSRDVTGKWLYLYQTCPADGCEISGKFLFQNAGNMDAPGTTVRFYLSEDGSFIQGRNPLLMEFTTTPIEGGGEREIRLEHRLGLGQDLRRQTIIAIIDPQNAIVESDKTNNYVMGRIN